jgi:ribosomal subunit interface protein
MHIEFRFQNTDFAEVLKGYIERRLRFALGRFGDRVEQVTVRISGKVNEYECRIIADLRPFGRVIVEETDVDLFSAVDRAAGRLGRLFGRKLQRLRALRRSHASLRMAA